MKNCAPSRDFFYQDYQFEKFTSFKDQPEKDLDLVEPAYGFKQIAYDGAQCGLTRVS